LPIPLLSPSQPCSSSVRPHIPRPQEITGIPTLEFPYHPPDAIRLTAFDHLNRSRSFEGRIGGLKPGTDLGGRNKLREICEQTRTTQSDFSHRSIGRITRQPSSTARREVPTSRVKMSRVKIVCRQNSLISAPVKILLEGALAPFIWRRNFLDARAKVPCYP
jgi:hypothetical protein